MRKYLFLILSLLATSTAFSQSLSIFDVEASNFPKVKAKFFAFDSDYKQIMSSNISDYELLENGQGRKITRISCPQQKPPQALSSVLVIDVSPSMSEGPPRIQSAKDAANAWVDGLPLGQSECALVSFSNESRIVQDFTTSRDKLKIAIQDLTLDWGTNYNQALIDFPAGGLQIAKTGRYKRVVVILTDGMPNHEPKTSEIIKFANDNQITIYAVTLNMPTPNCLKEMARQTGGMYYENITSLEEAKDTYKKLLITAQGGEPCELEWMSGPKCDSGMTNVFLKSLKEGTSTRMLYDSPNAIVGKIDFKPASIFFRNLKIGMKVEEKVTVTAYGSDFEFTDISLSNNKYSVSPSNFYLKKGESIEIMVSYTPSETGYSFCQLEFKNDNCPVKLFVSSGSVSDNSSKKTLVVTKPTLGDVYVVGSDTVITWSGIPESDTVSLEYSIDNGESWKLITKSATSLKYNWNNVPKPASNKCLIRAKQYILNEYDSSPGSLQFKLKGHEADVVNLTWSPDGARIATISLDKTCIVWDAFTGDRLQVFEGVYTFAWSPDGSKIATTSTDYTGVVRDAITGDVIFILKEYNKNITNCVWSPDGSKIATVCNINSSIIWDATTGLKLFSLNGHKSTVNCLSWSPDGRRIASASSDNTSIIWDAINGNKLHTLIGHTNSVVMITWNHNGDKVATSSFDQTAIIWDANANIRIHTLLGHKKKLNYISWSPDSKKVATASDDEYGMIWDAESGSRLYTLIGHKSYVNCITWNPDGTKVATASNDNTCKMWNVVDGTEIFSLKGHSKIANVIKWSPNGNYLASSSADKIGIVWKTDNGAVQCSLSLHTFCIRSAFWNSNGSKIASLSDDKSVIIWDALRGVKLHKLNLHSKDITSVSWSPDGSKLATTSMDDLCLIWDANTGQVINTLSAHTGGVNYVSWSPDGSKLATTSWDKTGIIWDALSGKVINTLIGHNYCVHRIFWSPDGKRLASAGWDSTCIIWDAQSGEKLHTLKGHSYYQLFNAEWCPDGRKVATVSNDKTVIIWDVLTGKIVHKIIHDGYATSVSWSPDINRIATTSQGKLFIWDTNTGANLLEISHNEKSINNPTWSYDGSKIAARYDQFHFVIFDAITGSVVYLFDHYQTNCISWSSDDSKIVSSGCDLAVKTWIISKSVTLIQQDESDLFSIVEPMPKCNDIDMKQCYAGTVKDSLVADFVSNIGSWKFSVDSIYFRGADASHFSLVSGFPKYIVEAGHTKPTEIRFAPKEARVYHAEVIIVTQAETLIQTIRGEGIEPQLEVYSGILDFGEVEIGKESTIRDTVLLKNISGVPIDITKTVKLYPDIEQFEILDGGGSFTLLPNAERKLTLQFKPRFGGRTSGRLGFEYNGLGSPATVLLFGTGIGGMITIPYDSGYAGDKMGIPLILEKVKPEGIQAMAARFSADVKFHGRLLYPQDGIKIKDFSNDSITVVLEGSIPNSNILTHLPVVVGLGNVEETTIEISNFKLFDNNGNDINYDVDYSFGKFKLLGVCREGGTRLINPLTKAGIINASPNPADNYIEIEVSLTELGKTELSLYNSLGIKELTIIDNELSERGIFTYRIDTSSLSTGQYFLQFRSPTFIDNKNIILVK